MSSATVSGTIALILIVLVMPWHGRPLLSMIRASRIFESFPPSVHKRFRFRGMLSLWMDDPPLRPYPYAERDAPRMRLRGEGTHTDYVLTNTEW